MKRQIGFVICAVAVSSILYGSPDSDRIAQKLVNASSKAFGSFKMFDKSPDVQGLSEWSAVIAEGVDLVRRANKNSKKSQEYTTRITTANNNLINGINGVYNYMFLPYANKESLSSQEMHANVAYKNKFVATFNAIKDDMEDLINKVNTTTQMKEKDTLIELARALSSYADNAIASIDFKITTDPKFAEPTLRPWMLRR